MNELPKSATRYHVVLLGAGASIAALPDGDKFGRKLPTLVKLAEITGIKDQLLQYFDVKEIEDFEALFSKIYDDVKYETLVNDIKNTIWDYFSSIELPDQPTLYDLLILSLRGKDVIATFNWDPLLIQAYERIKRHLAYEGYSDIELPFLLFLHGNVGIRACKKHRRIFPKGYSCNICRGIPERMELLYPVAIKNYQENDFIEDQWKLLRECLDEGVGFFSIFGYGAPKTDIEAKELLKNSWTGNSAYEFNEIEIIDVAKKDDLETKWNEFLFSHHYSLHSSIKNSYMFKTPRRSIEAIELGTLYARFVRPAPYKPVKKYESIESLIDSMKPLFDEERRLKNDPNYSIMEPMIRA